MSKQTPMTIQGSPKNKARIAALTYLLFFLPRFTEWKEDPEMHYHTKQAIGLLVFALCLQGIISILGYWGMPAWRVWPVRGVLIYLLWIGINHGQGGKLQPLPWIGKYAERIF